MLAKGGLDRAKEGPPKAVGSLLLLSIWKYITPAMGKDKSPNYFD